MSTGAAEDGGPMMKLTKGLMGQLEQVNLAVNRLPYRTDPERWAKPEFWVEIDQEGGDCEDFALEKRRRLLHLGWPLEALRLAVCEVKGEGHCVLTVDGIQNGLPETWVLDNRYPYPMGVRALAQEGYRWVSRQAAGLPGWVTTSLPTEASSPNPNTDD